MTLPPDISSSIWIHAVIVGSLIPSFLQVRAGRAKWILNSEFISDVAGFVVLIIGAIVSVTTLQPWIANAIAGYFVSTPKENVGIANVVLAIAEYVTYKKIILGRSWRQILPKV